jgi:hypothetical protein
MCSTLKENRVLLLQKYDLHSIDLKGSTTEDDELYSLYSALGNATEEFRIY